MLPAKRLLANRLWPCLVDIVLLLNRRQCLGMALAKMNYTAILAMLLGNFTCTLAERMGGGFAEGVMAAQKYEITLTPSTGRWMHCHMRASDSPSRQHAGDRSTHPEE